MYDQYSGRDMKALSGVIAFSGLAVTLATAGCSKETKTKETATAAAQDTMLMRDLAEANRNTASAAATDNSLTTMRMSGDSSSPVAIVPSGNTPTDRVVSRPLSTENSTTTAPRLTVPARASDASGPTTVSINRSPASESSARRSSGDPCDSPNLTDQRYCLNRSIATNDADLNSTYQELIAQAHKSGGADLEERFRQSQRDWINQRDTECRAQTPSQDGKLWARALGRCLAGYSSRRTAELQRSLSGLRGQ
jgi:uncharacterized protein YecT (DUF1311 family)